MKICDLKNEKGKGSEREGRRKGETHKRKIGQGRGKQEATKGENGTHEQLWKKKK